MDLLGGYNSDSSDDESPHNIPGGSAQLNVPAAASTTESLLVTKQVPRSGDTAKPNKKGKKLLRLQAVLPQHIWNQLTNDAAGDADSDDEQATTRVQKPLKQQPVSETPKKVSVLSEDMGNLRPKFLSSSPQADTELSSLLMALPKTKGSTSSSSILRPATNATNDLPTPVTTDELNVPKTTQARPTASSTLGAAFLSVSTQVTRKRKDGSNVPEVQDIHAAPAAAPSVDSVQDVTPTRNPATASASISASSASWSIPRPSAASVHARAAAPSVRTSAPMPRPPQPQSSMPSYQTAPQGVASYAPAPQPTAAAAVPSHSKKSRKRQMEAMLRAGNLSEIDSDVHIAPPDASGSLPMGNETAASTVNIHGVRVVPTTSYQVGAGGMTASTSVSGKQRGKNQLSALLVNAASLESKRKEQALFPTNLDGGAQNGRQKRANAKRKYGW